MAKYEITFVCGHKGLSNIIGPIKNRQRIADRRAEGLCTECYLVEGEKKRAAENAANAEKAAEQELPMLLGSIKQIAYGESCRQRLIAELEIYIERFVVPGITKDEASETLQYIMQTKKNAKWWIEPGYDLEGLLTKQRIKMLAEQKIAEAPSTGKEKSKVNPEATIRPEDVQSEVITKIRVVEDIIEVHFSEKHDVLYKLAKESLKLSWISGRWERKIVGRNGSVEDRAAEIGHRILAKGFIVRIENEKIRLKALSGEYDPECTNWIGVRSEGPQKDWLYISWAKGDDFYKAAKKISGSRYEKPGICVPPKYFDEVIDFADKHSFRISKLAMKTISNAKLAKDNALIINVPKPKERIKIIIDEAMPVLEIPEGVKIDAEFRDYD